MIMLLRIAFTRVHASDLAPSTAFPFALDNQWLPDEIIADDSDMKGQFMHYGFEAECSSSSFWRHIR